MQSLVLTLAIISADYGSVSAIVDHVHDGDSIIVNVPSWPAVCGQKIGIRLKGIDCPEIHDPNPIVAAWSAKGRALNEQLCPPGTVVNLLHVSRDEHFRFDADVVTAKGVNLATEQIKAHYARAYDGRTKRAPWTPADCGVQTEAPTWPHYPIRGNNWSYPGSIRSHIVSAHGNLFDHDWLATQSEDSLRALHSDAHEGRIKWAYAVRSASSSSPAACTGGACPATNSWQGILGLRRR